MHVIKAGWVGQTFALAKCNDSGGKKSRIRRSKDERKALVESFIKKYQKLNNGSFPSLNLTHKEVGGSFYTVREIVREVIQENKVLGPAIFTQGQQNHDDISEQYPIGSISVEPETALLSSNGSHRVTNIFTHRQDTSEILVPSASVQGFVPEGPEHHILGDGLYIDGSSEVFLKNKEHERETGVSSEDREILVLEKSVEDIETSCAKKHHSLGDGLYIDGSSEVSLKNEEHEREIGVSSEDREILVLEENVEGTEASSAKESHSLGDGLYIDGSSEVFLKNEEHERETGVSSEDREILVLEESAEDKEASSAKEHHSLADELYIDGSSEVFLKNEEHERETGVFSEDREILVLEESVEDIEASSAKEYHLEADFMLASSSLTSGSGITYGLDDKFSNVNGDSGEKGGESSVIDGMNCFESAPGLGTERNEASLVDPQLEKSYYFADGKLVDEVEVPLEGNLDNYIAKEGNDIFPNHHQDGSEELVLTANVQGLEPEHQSVGEGLQINGLGKTSEKKIECEREVWELEGSVDDLEAYKDKVTCIAADTIEAFPLPPVFGRTYGSDEKSSGASVLNENWGEKGDHSVVDGANFQEGSSGLTNAQTIANLAVQQLENCRDMVIEKSVGKVEVPFEEISEVFTAKEDINTSESIDTKFKDASVVGYKTINLVNGSNNQSSKDAKIRSSERAIPKMATATERVPNSQLGDALKETNPTLDRMNLESWKTSDKSQKPTNPLLVLIKAFVTAFVKFWSE